MNEVITYLQQYGAGLASWLAVFILVPIFMGLVGAKYAHTLVKEEHNVAPHVVFTAVAVSGLVVLALFGLASFFIYHLLF